MFTSYRSFIVFFAVIFAGMLVASCSAEKNNVISKGYHNTTARYNAIFYAKNRIDEIENIIETNHEDNYDRVLRVFPYYDSLLATTYKEQTEDAIQKASLAIDRHKNSKFVDDGYLLVGKARMYDVDYVNAVETFKYVYKHGEDAERVLALAYLIRSYTDNGEYQNALEVSSYLRKENIQKNEAKLVYINLAYLYQMLDDKNLMIQNLDKAAPLVTRADGKGRIYFIMGQVYETLGFESEAFGWYRKCIATHPKYELDFHARIRMAQVAELKGASDVKATRKLFEKLLVDKKNKQFIDKIYYEMGEFEAKQGNLDAAIDRYELALLNSPQPNRQKALSYLRLGQIYYDSLRKYSLAKEYYDSTIQILPQDFENYEKIAKRQSVLADFVTQLTTIQVQDSLLSLASIDSITLSKQFRDQLVYEDSIAQRKMEEAEISKKRAARRTNFLLGDNTGFSSTSWYFDNPTAIAQGQSEFTRIWGDRPLEDNWRRSSKQVFRNYDDQADLQAGNETDVEMQDPAEVEAAMEARMVQRVSDIMAQIPYSEAAKQASLKQVEEAHYQLGNIYYFDLEEEENAISTFEELYRRFPNSSYTPEILYQLVLIYQRNDDPRGLELRKVLLSEYSKTMYAQLIENPDYNLQNSQIEAQMRATYSEVYDLFKNGDYAFALAKVDSALAVYPETDFTANLALLRIMVLGKNETKQEYEDQLLQFIENNPDHEMAAYANELFNTAAEFSSASKESIRYLENRNAEHYFVMIYNDENGVQEEVNRTIQAHNTTKWKNYRLRLSSLKLNESEKVSLVTSFEDGRTAYNYLKAFEQNSVINPELFNGKSNTFVISKHNFDILYQTGEVEEYLLFFNQNYRNGIFEEGQ